jgi:alkanesulfonate monooxygenase SsuD/methylene tetrahydromethanopterin reductase-like flavin-dependent oxidoreductase (luciferase family)
LDEDGTMPTPKIGVFLPPVHERRDGFPGDLTASARHAEELGLESVWVVDQLICGPGEPILDHSAVHARPNSASNTA